MNVFIREMKANSKSLIVWSIAICLMVASGMGKYAGLSASGQTLNDLLAQMPKSLQAILGMGTFDLSSVRGYFGLLFIYLLVMATIHATMLGATIISKEERDKTADFLLVKPIPRNIIITAKLLASLVNILIINFVTFVASVYMVQKFSKGQDIVADIVMLMVGLFISQLIFLFIGTAIAAISKNPKTAPSVSTGILLVTFILSIAIDINSRIESLKYFTPFKYFDAKILLVEGGFNSVFLMLSTIIISLLLCATYFFYWKRDLRV